jgi:hypothetical protein
MTAAPPFTPFTRIVEQARIHPLQVMPPQTHQSYPFPTRGVRGGVQMVFFYCPAKILDPLAGLTLWPPTYVANLSAAAARFEELKAVNASDFGQRHSADKPLGNCRTPGQALEGPFMSKLAKWYQAFDLILPCFAVRTYGLAVEQQRATRDFASLLPEIVEAPLMPYYKAAAGEFFDWLKLMG